jgi:hypothetical protein
MECFFKKNFIKSDPEGIEQIMILRVVINNFDEIPGNLRNIVIEQMVSSVSYPRFRKQEIEKGWDIYIS